MAIAHARISITTAETLLSKTAAGKDGQTILIQNPSGGNTVYLGGTGVTSSDYGYILLAGTDMSVDLQNGESFYGIVASSTQTVNVLYQGV